MLDDDVDGLRLVLVVLHLTGERLLQEVGEVDPDVPGGGLHQVRLDVLQTLLRGQEVHQPLGGRRTEGDDVVDGINPVNHAGSRIESYRIASKIEHCSMTNFIFLKCQVCFYINSFHLGCYN